MPIHRKYVWYVQKETLVYSGSSATGSGMVTARWEAEYEQDVKPVWFEYEKTTN